MKNTIKFDSKTPLFFDDESSRGLYLKKYNKMLKQRQKINSFCSGNIFIAEIPVYGYTRNDLLVEKEHDNIIISGMKNKNSSKNSLNTFKDNLDNNVFVSSVRIPFYFRINTTASAKLENGIITVYLEKGSLFKNNDVEIIKIY